VSLGIAFLPLIGAWTYGAWTLQREPETDPGARMTPIAIAQGNVAVGARWDPSRLGQNLDTYLELTRRAVDAGPARIVFWPESAMTYFLEQDPLNHRRLTLELARLDVELLAGAPRIVETPEQRYFNSIYRVLPNGEIAGRYDKEYLVPFAEYFPLDIDLLRRKFGRIRYFDHGTQTAPLDTRAGRAGVIVCNEAMLPEVVGQRVADGAEYLFNPSNDTWISDPQYTEQQLDIARARAIEQRRTLVRASTAGPSAIIDPTGRVVAMTEPLRADYLLGEIGSSTGRSIYGRVGDLFALLCLAVTAGAAAYAHRVRPEERRAVSPRVPQ
jgi:apolipoprotein N-acyltransferase